MVKDAPDGPTPASSSAPTPEDTLLISGPSTFPRSKSYAEIDAVLGGGAFWLSRASPVLVRKSDFSVGFVLAPFPRHHTHIPPHAAATIARCQYLQQSVGLPLNFYDRTENDRFVPGTGKPTGTLIKNAKIWMGLHNGAQVPKADLRIDKGLLIGAGSFGYSQLKMYGSSLEEVDADGAWLTLGVVDLYSHLGRLNSRVLQRWTAILSRDRAAMASKLGWSGYSRRCIPKGDFLSPTTATLSASVRFLASICGMVIFPFNLCLTDIRNKRDLFILDGDNASPEALPDVEDEGANERLQARCIKGNEVYKDDITIY
ncbi:hypothetical protein ARMGADRAFT_1083762 [Armillaria gallica]|uniref:Uncharacterized protein n=1 Tax=Armillaria gallica TaxID=47427 RepID=A0A2H3DEE0_ARMGA|nr:hypothetical protein ARMGADRAFT_1083762 [Armillaria gallica]